MRFSRRRFLQNCSAALAAHTCLPRFAGATQTRLGSTHPYRRALGVSTVVSERMDPALMQRLALRAIDAAKSAGAAYADVRLTRVVTINGFDTEEFAVGVRALVKGSWGFAASPFWTLDEMPILATTAVAQAKANIAGSASIADLGTIPVASGSWSTPIEIDPTIISIEERADFLAALGSYVAAYTAGQGGIDGGVSWTRMEKAVATSEGTYFTQTTFRMDSGVTFVLGSPMVGGQIKLPFRHQQPGGRGWELVRDAQFVEQVPRLFEEAKMILALPTKPFDVGRYDVVFDGGAMASLVAQTIGTATELDRALGYEANAGGTSYLGPDPLALLGQFKVGSPLLTVTADRAMAGGLATVKWDDEGVEPTSATLVKDGILHDYQTTRELASELAPWYEKAGLPIRSHGYAASESALNVTMQLRPNLVLASDTAHTTVDDLIANTKKGLAFFYGGVSPMMDFQARNGLFQYPIVFREITNGKLGALILNGGLLFNSIELWKNLTALGGTETTETRDFSKYKGQPHQGSSYSVSASAGIIKDMALIDPTRRV